MVASRELDGLLGQLTGSDQPDDPIAWLGSLLQFLGAGHAGSARSRRSYTSSRVRLLVHHLRRSERRRTALRALVTRFVAENSAEPLLADVGVDRDRGLWSAVVGRLARRVVPEAPDASDLRTVLFGMLGGEASVEWCETLPEEEVGELLELLDPDGSTFAPYRTATRDAAALLAARACALGLTLNEPRTLPPARASVFWRLPRACEELLDANTRPEVLGAKAEFLRVIGECRRAAELAWNEVEGGPVETRLVLRLHVVRDSLDRLQLLASQLATEITGEEPAQSVRLLGTLMRAQVVYRAATPLWAKAWKPLSRRIVEHAGGVGRHYIGRSSAEWHGLLTAGAGGGLLTVATTGVKLLLASAALSLFWGGLAASANYVLSFLLLQLCGFVLATKQPSMTAAALAASVDMKAGHPAWLAFSSEVAHVVRSQVASLIGNLGIVIPGAIIVQLAFAAAGTPVLDDAHAHKVLESLNPWQSRTVLFGVVTGVILWLSSVAGGWLENWARCRRLPESFARHPRLVGLLGAERANRWAAWFDHHLCGIGSNLGLGLLLGMVPALAIFFGLGVEVRHVTLSAGSLAFAGASLGAEAVLSGPFLAACAGIVVIGITNLTVSFSLSLWMALRSRGEPVTAGPVIRAALKGLVLAVRRSPNGHLTS